MVVDGSTIWGNSNVFHNNSYNLPEISENALYIHFPTGNGKDNIVYCTNTYGGPKPLYNTGVVCVVAPNEEPTLPPVTPAPTTEPTPPPVYDFVTPPRPDASTPYRNCDSFFGKRNVQVSTANELER